MKRIAKMIFNKSGGTGKGITNRLTIPTSWVKDMGLSFEDREVEIEFNGKEIVIRKAGN